ncbi:MAG TPA: ABC-type transport auxiliary lipoprotein family protein [Burkholderiaceae bacterium]|jgi:cholesterol transport system auxiliary component|nr:ABC-type transport auxiliary lipoprotein family protein [Burkholderiaceae bacterium]
MTSITPITRLTFTIAALLCGAVLSACATRAPTPVLYDFGPLRAAETDSVPPARLPPIRVAEVRAPMWLDSRAMYFRLAYADEQQTRPYASSRWTMPPAMLFGQRLKARLAQAGSVVLAASDRAVDAPLLLRIEAEEFMQTFASPTASSVRVAVRASVFNGHTLLAQKPFMRQESAPTPDASGGAHALAIASDGIITDMIAWLAQLPAQP